MNVMNAKSDTVDKVTSVIINVKTSNGKKGKYILTDILPSAEIEYNLSSPIKFTFEANDVKFIKIK